MTIDEYKVLSGDAKPDGPETNRFWKIYLHDGKLFCPAGYYHYGMAADPQYPLLIRYHDLRQSTWANLSIPNKDQLGYNAVDANCMAFDPNDAGHFWVGSRSGLFEYKNYDYHTFYNCSNSTLKSISHKENNERVLISSMTYDSDGNLWVLNSRTNTPINRYTYNSTPWAIFPHKDLDFPGRNSIDMQGVFISSTNGLMWWANTFGEHETSSGVFVYDYINDRIHKYGSFTNQNGEKIDASLIYEVTEDKDGNLWISSTSGPFYIERSEAPTVQAFDNTPKFIQPVINRNDDSGLGDYLLSSVPIRCIRTDVANRKWMGSTTSGVFIISSDNQTEIEHFTTENSPLPADEIYDIKIDDNTGIVYISTSRGLCSYQTDITSGYGTLNEDNIYSYPNPVSPDYTGPITIRGLYEQCQIKITTSSGYIVHKGIVSGGSYKWDGCDQNGDRVASGVYMVLIETPEGSKGCVTKIAVLK
jgi:ligand-binding sensor domain-containing protein